MLRGFFYLFFTPESSVGCLQPLHPQLTDWSSFAHPVASLGRSWLFAPPCPNASHLVDTIVILPPLCRKWREIGLILQLVETFGRIGGVFRRLFVSPQTRALRTVLFAALQRSLQRFCQQGVRKETGHIVRLGVACWLVENNETSINASQIWFECIGHWHCRSGSKEKTSLR